MNTKIEIVKPRIQRPLIYLALLTIYFLIACIAFSLDNLFLRIGVSIVLFFVTALYIDKFFFSKKIGTLDLLDNSIEITLKDHTENIELNDLNLVSINAALKNPFGRRELSKCQILLLTLNYRNKKEELFLSNNKTSFNLIDEYLVKLNRMGIKLQ